MAIIQAIMYAFFAIVTGILYIFSLDVMVYLGIAGAMIVLFAVIIAFQKSKTEYSTYVEKNNLNVLINSIKLAKFINITWIILIITMIVLQVRNINVFSVLKTKAFPTNNYEFYTPSLIFVFLIAMRLLLPIFDIKVNYTFDNILENEWNTFLDNFGKLNGSSINYATEQSSLKNKSKLTTKINNSSIIDVVTRIKSNINFANLSFATHNYLILPNCILNTKCLKVIPFSIVSSNNRRHTEYEKSFNNRMQIIRYHYPYETKYGARDLRYKNNRAMAATVEYGLIVIGIGSGDTINILTSKNYDCNTITKSVTAYKNTLLAKGLPNCNVASLFTMNKEIEISPRLKNQNVVRNWNMDELNEVVNKNSAIPSANKGSSFGKSRKTSTYMQNSYSDITEITTKRMIREQAEELASIITDKYYVKTNVLDAIVYQGHALYYFKSENTFKQFMNSIENSLNTNGVKAEINEVDDTHYLIHLHINSMPVVSDDIPSYSLQQAIDKVDNNRLENEKKTNSINNDNNNEDYKYDNVIKSGANLFDDLEYDNKSTTDNDDNIENSSIDDLFDFYEKDE